MFPFFFSLFELKQNVVKKCKYRDQQEVRGVNVNITDGKTDLEFYLLIDWFSCDSYLKNYAQLEYDIFLLSAIVLGL